MATVSVTGNAGGPYTITGTNYKIVVTAAGITELYALSSSAPETNLMYAGYNLCIVVGESLNYNLSVAGVLSLPENTPTRVIVKCTGDMKPTGGGATKGTGTFYVTCYPDHYICQQTATMTSDPSSGVWTFKAVHATLNTGVTYDAYSYSTTPHGGYTSIDPGTALTTRATGGPFGLLNAFELGATDYSISMSVCMVTGWTAGATLKDSDNATRFFLSVEEAGATNTAFTSAVRVDLLPLVAGALDVSTAESLREWGTLCNGTIFDSTASVGAVKTNDPLDAGGDGFVEARGAWTFTADGERVTSHLSEGSDLLNSETLYSPVIEVTGITPAYIIEYVKTSANGVNWTTLEDGTNFNEDHAGNVGVVQLFGTYASSVYVDIRYMPDPALYSSQGVHEIRGLYGITATVGVCEGRGLYGFTSPQGTMQIRGLYRVPTANQGVMEIRGLYMVGTNSYTHSIRGLYGFHRSYSHDIRGLYRLAAPLDKYRLYLRVDDAAMDWTTPYATSDTLPFDTLALDPGHTYHLVTREVNGYGLETPVTIETSITVAADGTLAATPPSAPYTISAVSAGAGKVTVTAYYRYLEDGLNAGSKGLVYWTNTGVDPDPATDTPAQFTISKVDGLGKITWTSAAQAEGTVVKALVRVRRTGTPNVDSVSTAVVSATATLLGPDAPAVGTASYQAQGEQAGARQ